MAAGVTEEMIRLVVHTFYARVRRDPYIGPVFNAAVADWDDHLAKLCDFWSSVLLMSGRFKGSPMQAHARQPIEDGHFDRWLSLFGETVRECAPPDAAGVFIERAEMIGQSLRLGLARAVP